MGRGFAWLDTGTHESLLEAVAVHRDDRAAAGAEDRLPRGNRLSRWATSTPRSVERLGQAMAKNGYGQYLLALLREPSVR